MPPSRSLASSISYFRKYNLWVLPLCIQLHRELSDSLSATSDTTSSGDKKSGWRTAEKLFDRLSIGAQFLMLSTQNRKPTAADLFFTFEGGLLAELMPQLNIGFHVFSPVRVEWLEGDQVPLVLNLGFSYQPTAQFLLTVQVEKDIEYEASFKAGIEYRIIDPLFFRAGVGTKPTTVHFGIGYALTEQIAFDAAASYHQVLGYTPGVGLSYSFK